MLLCKRLFILFIAITASSISFGQKLFGIDMDTTVEAFCSQMVNKGFKYSKILESTKNYIGLEGELLGQKDVVIAVYNTPISKKVWAVAAMIDVDCNKIDDLDRDFYHYKQLLSYKYGETDNCVYNIDENIETYRTLPKIILERGYYERRCYWETDDLFIMQLLKDNPLIAIKWESKIQQDLEEEEQKLKVINEL